MNFAARQSLKLIICIIFLFSALFGAADASQVQYPEPVSVYVNDFAQILDPVSTSKIETSLANVRETRGVEMTVVTITSRAEYGASSAIEPFATALFNQWGVGNPDKNDGIMVLVSIEDRDMRIELGKGYPSYFDEIALDIINNTFIPSFKSGDFSGGIDQGVREIIQNINLDLGDTRPSFFTKLYNNARSGGIVAWILGALSSLIGIFGIKQAVRFRPRTCSKCQRKMSLLSEVRDDDFLCPGEALEEKIKSRNYDVWHCKYDNNVIINGYTRWFSGYSACQSCGFRTVESERTVILPASTVREGQARIDYECRKCGNKWKEMKTIPKISSSSSSSSSSSFSGGSSSGGGASGSW